MLDPDRFEYLKQCLTEPLTIVCITDTCEAQKSTLELPFSGSSLFNPMSSHGKISVCVAGLPGITCDIHFASDGGPLDV